MKYADGFWLDKPGYGVNYATQIYEVTTDGRSVNVLAVNHIVENRGQTLGGPVLEITFTSTLENTIKVTVEHFKGRVKKAPSFELYENADFRPAINETDGAFELISGKTRVIIPKSGAWDIKYYYDKKLLTKQGWRTTSYITEEQWRTNERRREDAMKTFFSHDETGDGGVLREMMNIGVGESIYGFGEKFSPFVKNGQTVDVWNNDGGTSSEQTYKSIPFYVSSKGYGLFVNHPEKVNFEVASETVSKVAFSVRGERLEYFVIGGEKIADVLRVYTDLTGKPALTPAYSFGLWLTTSFTTNYDEKTVSGFIDGMAERDIPLEVFHFDSFWMKEFNWCDLTWDKRIFPDPAAMLGRLKAKGVEICVWINPYIAQRSSMFDEGLKGGYFLKTEDGSVWQGDMWQPGMAIVDFTNPSAREWYKGKLRALCEMGVDVFKTDFGERIPTKGIVYYDGSDPYKMHNFYSYIYNKTVFEVLEEYYGTDKACLFARSATVGGQKFPVHWGGDCFSNYESMWETLRGGLSLCMSGFGFFSHDISGFEAQGTPDLYKRWCAFGLMSTHSRLHGNSSYRVPWNFDEESCEVLRHWTKLKGRLMPYLWTQAINTHVTGVPMMRAMLVDYTGDPACAYLDRQYMLGDSLLIAPVFNEEGTAEFYVPAGKWTDIQSGKVYEGGRWYATQNDYYQMPVLARPGSIIAYGSFKRAFEYDYASGAELVIYQLADGETAETEIYDTSAKRVVSVKASRSGDVITVTADNKAPGIKAKSAEELEIIYN